MNVKMNAPSETVLSYRKDGRWYFQDSPTDSPRPVCSIREACQKLHKSRRHIYRYIKAHQLNPLAKIFGEILLDVDEITHLKKTPFFVQPLPAFLRLLFPEYDVSTLNAGRFRNLIINRVLELGSLKQVKWLMHRYSKKDIIHAIQEDGQRFLSDRALTFWSLYFNLKLSPSWRTKPKNPWQH